jgi:hypothetical protein
MFVLFSCSSFNGSIYVSTNGDDANDGLSPSKPVRTLVKAMKIANTMENDINVVIKVSVGLYTPGDGLNSANTGFVINRPNVTISGGWNNNFNRVVGKSELDGNNSLYHVVMITNVTNVKLENLVIRGGNANGSSTSNSGEAYMYNISYLVIKGEKTNDSPPIKSIFPNNSGGGIFVYGVSYLVIESNVMISGNYAKFGGGLYLDSSTNNTISGSVYGNSAEYGGGCICGIHQITR